MHLLSVVILTTFTLVATPQPKAAPTRQSLRRRTGHRGTAARRSVSEGMGRSHAPERHRTGGTVACDSRRETASTSLAACHARDRPGQWLRLNFTHEAPGDLFRNRCSFSRTRLPSAARRQRFRRGVTPIVGEQRGLVLIVRTASQFDVANRSDTALGIRNHVMKLEKRGLAAALTVATERTPPPIAAPHLTLHCSRNMASPARWPRLRKRSRDSAATVFQKIRHQQSQGPIENRRNISIRNGMAKEVARLPQLFACAFRNRHLKLVGGWRERHDNGSRAPGVPHLMGCCVSAASRLRLSRLDPSAGMHPFRLPLHKGRLTRVRHTWRPRPRRIVRRFSQRSRDGRFRRDSGN